MRPLISIGIPTYEMSGHGVEYLKELLETINHQTFDDFEVIISDHSVDSKIKDFINSSSYDFKINYFKNHEMRGNPSNNINKIISESNGEYIKFLFQDDLLNGEKSIQNIATAIKNNKDANWFVSGCLHIKGSVKNNYMIPFYNDKIHMGYNTISSPSVLTVKNYKEIIKFNDEFIWLLDCIYYKDCYLKFGPPVVINEFLVINRLSDTQLSNLLSIKVKYLEVFKAIKNYDNGFHKNLRLLEIRLNFIKHCIYFLIKNIKSKMI